MFCINLAWFEKLSFTRTWGPNGACGSSKILLRNWISTVNLGAVHLGYELRVFGFFWRENDWNENVDKRKAVLRSLTFSSAVARHRRLAPSRWSSDRYHSWPGTRRWPSPWDRTCAASSGHPPRSKFVDCSPCAAARQPPPPASF